MVGPGDPTQELDLIVQPIETGPDAGIRIEDIPDTDVLDDGTDPTIVDPSVTEQPQIQDAPMAQMGEAGWVPEPSRPQSRGMGSGRVTGLNDRYRYTNEDFYGPEKTITWTDPRGVQMHVPGSPRLPMGIIASRLQQMQADRAALAEANAKVFQQPMGDAPDPYKRSFAQLTSDSQGNFIKSYSDLYGGNEALALREIRTPGTKANRDWIALNRNLNALGENGKFVWGEAKAYLERAQTGNFRVNPKIMKAAENVYFGLGELRGGESSLADIQKLNRYAGVFTRAISREEFLGKQILPTIDKRYAQYADRKIGRDKMAGGKIVLDQYELKKLDDGFYAYLADEYTRMSPGTTYSENLEFFKSNIPQEMFSMKTSLENPYTPPDRSGSTPATAVVGAAADWSSSTPGSFDPSGELRAGYVPKTKSGEALRQITVKRNGEPVRMQDFVFKDTDRGYEFVGRVMDEGVSTRLQEIGETTVIDFTKLTGDADKDAAYMDAISIPEDTKKEVLDLWTKQFKMERIPAEGNEIAIDRIAPGARNEFEAAAFLHEKATGVKRTPDEMRELRKTKEGRSKLRADAGKSSPERDARNIGAATVQPGGAVEQKPKPTKGKLY